MHRSEAANFYYAQAVARLTLSGATECGHEGNRQPLYQVQPGNEANWQRSQRNGARNWPGFVGLMEGSRERRAPPLHLYAAFSSSTTPPKLVGLWKRIQIYIETESLIKVGWQTHS